jgi:hypothetical protein
MYGSFSGNLELIHISSLAFIRVVETGNTSITGLEITSSIVVACTIGYGISLASVMFIQE